MFIKMQLSLRGHRVETKLINGQVFVASVVPREEAPQRGQGQSPAARPTLPGGCCGGPACQRGLLHRPLLGSACDGVSKQSRTLLVMKSKMFGFFPA